MGDKRPAWRCMPRVYNNVRYSVTASSLRRCGTMADRYCLKLRTGAVKRRLQNGRYTIEQILLLYNGAFQPANNSNDSSATRYWLNRTVLYCLY